MSEQIFIGLNKRRAKITSISMGVLAIASLIIFWGLAENQEMAEPVVFKVIGVILCVLLVLVGANAARKANDTKAGVIINEQGITDATSSISIGLVKWADIREISLGEGGMLVISVKKPKTYIEAASNSAIKRLLIHNEKHYKSPVVIDSAYVEMTMGELESVVNEQFKKFKK